MTAGPTTLRTFAESELLLIKELTGSELTRIDVDTHGNETGSRLVRHIGSGKSVEQARDMNATIRWWGPLVAESLRGSWIRNSRDETLTALLAVSSTGAIHFSKLVEPHVLDGLVAVMDMIDRAPGLAHATDVLAKAAWQVLSQDPRHGSSIERSDLFVRDTVLTVERFVAPLVKGESRDAPYPRRVQAAANMLFAGTIKAIVVERSRRLPRLKNADSRARTLTRSISRVVRGVFVAQHAPAAGAVPSDDELERALAFVEARFAELGTDLPALFRKLSQDLA